MGYSFNDFLNDVQPVGVGIQDIVKTNEQISASVFNNFFSTIGQSVNSISSNLSLPLVLLGGGVLLFVLNKK